MHKTHPLDDLQRRIERFNRRWSETKHLHHHDRKKVMVLVKRRLPCTSS
jgi:hypothetical protein